MRISDWSSDVCSSDLRHRRIDRLVAALDLVVEFARQRCDAAHEGAGDAQYVDFRQDCFLNFEAGVSRSPPRTHTSPRPWSLPGSGFARPAIVTDFMSSAPESTSLCSAIPCYVPATPPHAQASWRWHSDLTTQERTQM